MLCSYLETGHKLHLLSRLQLFEVETQFALYLIKAQSFNETMENCDRVLDDDQLELHAIIKERLSEMISDADCNCKFKPAILRLANGDKTGFHALHAPSRRTQMIINVHRVAFDKALSRVVHPINEIGPSHLAEIEASYMDKIKKHTQRYVRRYARFLTLGDSTKDMDDIANDLGVFALCSMRGYYPFRSGLHMENSMRRTITNRGRSYITSSIAETNRSVVQLPDGTSYRREVSWVGDAVNGAPILDSIEGDDPRNSSSINLDLRKAAKGGGAIAMISQFILSPTMQEEFIGWLGSKVPSCSMASDITEAVRITGRSYEMLLGRFLALPAKQVHDALVELRGFAT